MKCHRIGVHLTFSTYPKQPLFSCGGSGGGGGDISKYVEKVPNDGANTLLTTKNLLKFMLGVEGNSLGRPVYN